MGFRSWISVANESSSLSSMVGTMEVICSLGQMATCIPALVMAPGRRRQIRCALPKTVPTYWRQFFVWISINWTPVSTIVFSLTIRSVILPLRAPRSGPLAFVILGVCHSTQCQYISMSVVILGSISYRGNAEATMAGASWRHDSQLMPLGHAVHRRRSPLPWSLPMLKHTRSREGRGIEAQRFQSCVVIMSMRITRRVRSGPCLANKIAGLEKNLLTRACTLCASGWISRTNCWWRIIKVVCIDCNVLQQRRNLWVYPTC